MQALEEQGKGKKAAEGFIGGGVSHRSRSFLVPIPLPYGRGSDKHARTNGADSTIYGDRLSTVSMLRGYFLTREGQNRRSGHSWRRPHTTEGITQSSSTVLKESFHHWL
jgi:hypothetical protein